MLPLLSGVCLCVCVCVCVCVRVCMHAYVRTWYYVGGMASAVSCMVVFESIVPSHYTLPIPGCEVCWGGCIFFCAGVYLV